MELILEPKDSLFRVSGHGQVINIHGDNDHVLACVSIKHHVFSLTSPESKLVHHLNEEMVPLLSGLFEAVECTL